MPRLSVELIRHEYKKHQITGRFGYYMNNKYMLKDIDLASELDDNMAMLKLLRDHVPEEKKQIWNSRS